MAPAVLAEGDNYRFSMNGDVVYGKVWKRPDLDSARGAENAQAIETVLLDWLKRRPRGLFLDVSEAPEVAGPKTATTLSEWFEAYAVAGVRIAVQVGPSALQRMQYQRMLSSYAGKLGRLCESESAALAFIRQD